MVFAGSKTEARLLFVIIAIIFLSIFYGFYARPVIMYHISTPLEYNKTIDFDKGDLRINLETNNIGLSPARIELTVRLYNLSLMSPLEAEVSLQDQYSDYHFKPHDPIKPSAEKVKIIRISSSKEANYLVLIFYADAQKGWNPFFRFFDSFIIFNPERPTALLLKQVSENEYMRVTSR